MNFPLQSKRTKKPRSRKVFVAFLLLVGILFGVNYIFNGVISDAVRTPAAALWSANGVLEDRVSGMTSALEKKADLQKERDALRVRVSELELYALNNLILASENEELQRLLGVETTILNKGILARVLSRGGVFPYGVMIISRESETPMRTGSLVFGEQNVLIGFVSEVGINNAVVQMVSAPEKETQALVGREDRISAITVRGIGNGNMVAEVARDADIRLDDPVVFFAEETALLGFVGDIETKPADAFQRIQIRTPLNLPTVRFVRVR